MPDELVFIEHILRKWPELPHGEVRATITDNEAVVTLAYPLHTLWVHHVVMVGKRGGLTESLVVLDPSKPVVVDRVVCRYEDAKPAASPRLLLDLTELREEGRGKTREQLCDAIGQAMLEQMRRLQALGLAEVYIALEELAPFFSASVRPTPGGYGSGKGGVRKRQA